MQFAVLAQLIGSMMQNGQQQQALSMRQQAADLYGAENLPQLDKLVAMQLPQNLIDQWGKATAATQAQGQALGALSSEVATKGETPEDKAAFQRARMEAQSVQQSGQGQAMRALASRGLGSSGLALAQSMNAGQAGANMANQADVQEAANARQRYLQAVNQLGSMAGQQRGQEIQSMSAQDALNQYNMNNAIAAQQWNANIPLQVFNARMQLASGKANALGGVANQYNLMGQTAANQGGAIGTGIATYAQQPQYQGYGSDPSANPYGPGGGAPAYQPPKTQPTDPSYWYSYGGTPTNQGY